ncbi:Hypothetical protein A7982_03836 [Minicystis rosea]|nr:Hypothetical protein A7982_03836 [Minicystis rosea]
MHASPSDPRLLIWHPGDKALWLFVPSAQQLWRIAADGTGNLLASGDALGMPASFPSAYLHGQAFYYDTARETVVWLFSTYAEGFDLGLALHAWNGSAFVPIAQENGIQVVSSDSFVFDPERGVLVHFAGQRDMWSEREAERRKRGGLTVRELGKDGVWRDAGTPLANAGTYETHAGWDGRRELTVLIDNETRETHGWDGNTWHALGKLPADPWKPNTMAQAPRTKNLVFLHHERGNPRNTALLWELTENGWSKREAGALESYGGAAYDPDRDMTFVFGPWLGPGTVPHTLARYDGEKLVLAGKPALDFSGGSMVGPAVFWGALKPVHGSFSHEARKPYSATVVFAWLDGALTELASSPPALALAASASGCVSVGFSGEVSRLAGGKFGSVADAPNGFVERTSTNMGIDESGRLFLVGGEPVHGTKLLTDAWSFDGRAWSEIPAKGNTPATTGAWIAFDAARGAWIYVGGHLKSYAPNPKTYEHDGKKWSSFASDFGDGLKSLVSITLLAYDAPSATTFLIGSPDYMSHVLYVYRGAGAWEAIASVECPSDISGIAYDSIRRVLVWGGAVSLAEMDVAPLLGSGPRPLADMPPPPEKTAKGTKAAPAEEALAPAVWLRIREGDSDKFWFAALDGASWTARWGRRGGKANEKSHALASEKEARAAYEKAVNEKIRKGYEHAAEKEDAARIPGKTSFHMVLGKKGEDTFGGIPAGVTKKTWPVCADCKHPMAHVFLLHAHAERLPLEKHAGIALFACNGAFSGGSCMSFEPDGGCNAALLLTADDLEKKPLRAAPTGPGGEEAPAIMSAQKIAYTAQFEPDPSADENAEDLEATSKVAGYPVWIQGVQTPLCAECHEPMRFVAQIQEDDEALNFGGGDGYLFCCPDEHGAKFLWQQ